VYLFLTLVIEHQWLFSTLQVTASQMWNSLPVGLPFHSVPSVTNFPATSEHVLAKMTITESS